MQDKTVYLNEVARECLAELDALDIHYGNIQAFTINTRSLFNVNDCKSIKDTRFGVNQIAC